MKIGNSEHFIIEVNITGRDGIYLFGTISYCIGGRHIGNAELVTLLGDYATVAPGMLCFRGRRESERMWAMDEKLAFRWLDERLYDSRGVDYPEEEIEAAARHNATIGIDSLDGWKIYVVQHGSLEKVIFSGRSYDEVFSHIQSVGESYDEVFSHIQPAGLFDSTVLEAFNRLNAILDEVEPNESAGQETSPRSVQPEQ